MNHLKNKSLNAQSAQLHVLFISVVVLTICAAWALAAFYSFLPAKAPVDPSIINFNYQRLLRPEPLERFVFLTLALAVPLSTFYAGLVIFRKTTTTRSTMGIWMTLLVLLVAVLFYLPLAGFTNSLTKDSLGGASRFIAYQYLALPGLAATFGFACFWYLRRTKRVPKPNVNINARLYQFDLLSAVSQSTYRRVNWIVFLFLISLQLGGWRLLSEASVTRGGGWIDSFDAVIYSVSQVAVGKTLLSDLPSQYGFFPLFMQPVFKVFGLSIFTFTALCAFLQVCSLASVYAVVQRVVRDKTLLTVYTLSLLAVTFGTVEWVLGVDDPFFQYWPIRFFWPAISVFVCYQYACRPKLFTAFLMSLTCAIGSIWNADTGLVIVVAFAGVLSAKWVVLYMSGLKDTEIERRNLLRALALHLLTFAMCVFLTLFWLAVNATEPLKFDWLFTYQKTFYGLGFNMLPMPTHLFPWMSILGIYLMSLIVAVQLWAFNPRSKMATFLVYLALLGLGLFTYYQGRSHPLVLIAVCWPALTLLVILSDRVIRAVKTNLLSKIHLAYPVAGLSVLLVFSAVLLIGLPRMFSESVENFASRNKPHDALVTSELSFIRQHARAGDECVILSLRYGSYHAATGLVSPLKGPGFLELLLQSDHDNFLNQIERLPINCIFVGLGKDSELKLGVNILSRLPAHFVSARSTNGSMLLLRPKI